MPLATRLEQVMIDYAPKPYHGDLVLVRASEFASGDTAFDPRNGWGKFVKGTLTVHQAPGNHLTMLMSGNVEAVGRLLNDLLLPGSPTDDDSQSLADPRPMSGTGRHSFAESTRTS